MRTQQASPFLDFRWGIERETHRVSASGVLSTKRHPAELEKPAFTLDFAETQLEMVTPPLPSIPEVLAELRGMAAQAQRVIKPELLWPFSMPPKLSDSEIRVAALERSATLYREGLALRYGKARQMICGLHVNVSFGSRMGEWLRERAPLTSEEESYELRLTRHLYRDLKHFVLLFSASPVREGSDVLTFSHRNGPTGYAGAEFLRYLDLGSVADYVTAIQRGLSTESPRFAKLGLVAEGRQLQLNSNVFQSEREFYAPIRIRQVATSNESSLVALSRRGAGYLELRFFDVDPYSPTGVAEPALRLLQLFLLDALVRPSSPPTQQELEGAMLDVAQAASIDPVFQLNDARFVQLADRLRELEPWAERVAIAEHSDASLRALASYRARAKDPRQLLSPTIARRFRESGKDWTQFGVQTALLHARGTSKARECACV